MKRSLPLFTLSRPALIAASFAVVLLGQIGVAWGQSGDAAAGVGEITAGRWRVTQAVVAPWARSVADGRAAPAWRGHWLRFHRAAVDGPGPLNCARAVFEPTRYPADGLFQGNLPTPAAASARALGLVAMPVVGFRLACDTGVYEFHRADAETLLLGLDNRVLVLSRAHGAHARPDSPEGRVQRLLEAHFAGDMAFSPTTVAAKRDSLGERLRQYIERYFRRPATPDEAPVIDGDPFTDSQEYPAWFAVGKASLVGNVVEVPVRFANGGHERLAIYCMHRERGAWRLVDIRYERGATLRDKLE